MNNLGASRRTALDIDELRMSMEATTVDQDTANARAGLGLAELACSTDDPERAMAALRLLSVAMDRLTILSQQERGEVVIDRDVDLRSRCSTLLDNDSESIRLEALGLLLSLRVSRALLESDAAGLDLLQARLITLEARSLGAELPGGDGVSELLVVWLELVCADALMIAGDDSGLGSWRKADRHRRRLHTRVVAEKFKNHGRLPQTAVEASAFVGGYVRLSCHDSYEPRDTWSRSSEKLRRHALGVNALVIFTLMVAVMARFWTALLMAGPTGGIGSVLNAFVNPLLSLSANETLLVSLGVLAVVAALSIAMAQTAVPAESDQRWSSTVAWIRSTALATWFVSFVGALVPIDQLLGAVAHSQTGSIGALVLAVLVAVLTVVLSLNVGGAGLAQAAKGMHRTVLTDLVSLAEVDRALGTVGEPTLVMSRRAYMLLPVLVPLTVTIGLRAGGVPTAQVILVGLVTTASSFVYAGVVAAGAIALSLPRYGRLFAKRSYVAVFLILAVLGCSSAFGLMLVTGTPSSYWYVTVGALVGFTYPPIIFSIQALRPTFVPASFLLPVLRSNLQRAIVRRRIQALMAPEPNA